MKPLIDQVDHKFTLLTVDYLHANPIASSPVISTSTIVITYFYCDNNLEWLRSVTAVQYCTLNEAMLHTNWSHNRAHNTLKQYEDRPYAFLHTAASPNSHTCNFIPATSYMRLVS